MAIPLNDSIRVEGNKPVEDKRLNHGVPYTSPEQVNSLIAITDRYPSLEVLIGNKIYWYHEGVTNAHLVQKVESADTAQYGVYKEVTNDAELTIEQGADWLDNPLNYGFTLATVNGEDIGWQIGSNEFAHEGGIWQQEVDHLGEGINRRIDAIYYSNGDGVVYSKGSETEPAYPKVPVDAILRTFIILTPEGIVTENAGYIKEDSEHWSGIYNQFGGDLSIHLVNNRNFFVSPETPDLVLKNMEHLSWGTLTPWDGMCIRIGRHENGNNVFIKHGLVESGKYEFILPNGADKRLLRGEILTFSWMLKDPFSIETESNKYVYRLISSNIGGDGGTGVFQEDIVVSLTDNKTLGKYVNGQTIPSEGWSFEQFARDIAVEAIPPTVTLTSSTIVEFNQTNIVNILDFSYIINSLDSSIQTVSLEWRRGNTGAWEELTTDYDLDTFTHSFTDSNFNTQPFNYRYTVTDDKGGTKTVTLDITPNAYVAPTISSFSAGSTSRDRGNIETDLSGTITRNSPLVDIEEYQIQYRVNGAGSWIDLGSPQSMSASGGIVSGNHNDVLLVDSDSLSYRVLVTDEYQTTTLTTVTVNFLYRNLLGYSSNTELTLSQILALSNSALSNSKSRTVTGVTAGVGLYTYYAYRAGAGDLTGIILDGAAPVLGAFTKLADVSGTNSFGAAVTYRIYRSNATQAFNNNTLTFN